MKVWVSTAVALLAVLPAALSTAGPCRSKKSHRCFAAPAILDLSKVPDISRRIADRAAKAQPPLQQRSEGQSEGYTGPIVGVSKLGRAPTVGYHWSLN
jgi:hypothetical protein